MFDTHTVTNQGRPLPDLDLHAVDAPLQDALGCFAPAHAAQVAALGPRFGLAEWREQARLANTYGPVLRTHDRFGHRIDEVEFHPAYHALMALALESGLASAPWAAPGPGAQAARAAGYYLFGQLENGVQCPTTMSYAVLPVVAKQPELQADWLPKLLAAAYDPRLARIDTKRAATMGMGMTEKQGGSDVRANSTRAEPLGAATRWGEPWRITGHKWFFSAPMCDAFLILAQTEPESSAGLSCFFLPRVLEDGSRNRIAIQRLKDKIGNRSNASSEVEFDGAVAYRVGALGRGVPTILEMGNHTRLDCTIGSAGIMRAGLVLAIDHARLRSAFGRRLAEQPLMRRVLADLALESEAAMWLALRLAACYDDGADGATQALKRVLTPAAKYWVCKRLPHFTAEAMEVLGGGGYVEEAPFGRLFRESPLNSIWEGSGNVMCLDVLRALGRGGDEVRAALLAEWQPARGQHPAFDALLAATEAWLLRPQAPDEAAGRALAERIALLTQAALLLRHAPAPVGAAFCATRLAAAAGTFGNWGLEGGAGLDDAAAARLVERALPPL